MNSNSKTVKQAIQKYITESINLEGYDIAGGEKEIESMWKIYLSEVGNYKANNQSEQENFKEWLKGMPSAMSVEVYYNEVREILISWGLNGNSPVSDTKAFDWFLNLIYREVKVMLNNSVIEVV